MIEHFLSINSYILVFNTWADILYSLKNKEQEVSNQMIFVLKIKVYLHVFFLINVTMVKGCFVHKYNSKEHKLSTK